MTLPIYELKISENLNDEAQVDYIALVDAPAIKKDFLAFNDQFIEPSKGEHESDFLQRCIKYVIDEGKESEQAVAICNSLWEQHFASDNKFEETYNDYPEQAKENAKIALRWAEENGWGDCGTEVGKIRANQLAKGENISRDTIARMSGFERHRQNSQKELGDGCGRLMWLAWGGDAGIEWATRKLAQIDKTKLSFAIISEEKRIVSGAIMLADELIFRASNKVIKTDHYVKFSADTIKAIAIKFAKKKYQNNVNLMHDPEQKVKGVTMFESWLVDTERGIMPMKGFEGVANGSWFGSFYVENEKVWQSIKKGDYKGFSVEGLFDYIEPISAEENALKKIEELLNSIIED